MTQINMRGWLFILALFAFSAPGVQYIRLVFTVNTRWAILALLGALLLASGKLFSVFRTRFGLPFGIYILWCFATVMWSDVPQLSFMKSAAFAVTAGIFIGAGYLWATQWAPQFPLSFLASVLVVALIAGLGGGPPQFTGTGINLYTGLSGNPNYLGMLIANSFPLAVYLAYRAYRNRSSMVVLAAAGGLVLVLLLLLWMSGSRASLLSMLVVGAMFFSTLGAEKKIFSVVALCMLVSGSALAVPELQQGVYTRLVVKSTNSEDIFFSRRQPWEQSYIAAQHGGWVGLGYGVSYGFREFSGGLTANTYGREKGNTQLAVWEETGFVGFVLYLVLLTCIIWEIYRGLRFAQTEDERVTQALLLGLVLGMTVVSVFEAWWTAPGAPESPIFWATVGVGAGMTQRILAARRERFQGRALEPVMRTPALAPGE